MSDKQTIDYDALAKQHGATNVDYDALAQQHGGRTESTTAKSNTVTGRKITAEPSLLSIRGLKSAAYNVADKITNLLPAAGGIGGGIIGASSGVATGGTTSVPGAIGGAALGGAAGESARQLARRAIFPADSQDPTLPTSSLDAAKAIGLEGVKQGVYEASGQGLRVLGRAMAPKIAEAAVTPGKRLLKSIPEDVNIGQTILNESKGYKPATIAKELGDKIAEHSKAADSLLRKAGDAGKRIPLGPAREIADEALEDAVSKNAPKYIEDVGAARKQLYTQFAEDGKPLKVLAAPPVKEGAGFVPVPVSTTREMVERGLEDTVSPERARNIRQGIDLTIGNWNPENQAAGKALRERLYGAVTGKIHEVVPEVAPHDAAMTSLIPSKQAAWNQAFDPGISKQIFEKLKRPTGALIGGTAGASEGYKHGGVTGAVVGGTIGLAGGNLIASPEGMMFVARKLESGSPFVFARRAVPLVASQLDSQERDENGRLKVRGDEQEEPDTQ